MRAIQKNKEPLIQCFLSIIDGEKALKTLFPQLKSQVIDSVFSLWHNPKLHGVVVGGVPVGQYGTVNAPFALENFLQEMLVFVGVHAVDVVKGGLAPPLHRILKPCEVSLPQSPLVYHEVGGHMAQLLGVSDETPGE